MTEGIVGVQNRILEIQRLVGATPPATSTSSTSSATTQTSSDFASLLAEATNATEAGADLSRYGNGKIPESLLTSIGGGDKLAGPAANAFLKMKNAASTAGISLSVNDSYRSYDEQVAMAKQKGIYGQGGLAAVPGKSNHGNGISLDIEMNSANQAWMKANASTYGWVNDVPGEPWHWTYKG